MWPSAAIWTSPSWIVVSVSSAVLMAGRRLGHSSLRRALPSAPARAPVLPQHPSFRTARSWGTLAAASTTPTPKTFSPMLSRSPSLYSGTGRGTIRASTRSRKGLAALEAALYARQGVAFVRSTV